jgi:hypothetical protein
MFLILGEISVIRTREMDSISSPENEIIIQMPTINS